MAVKQEPNHNYKRELKQEQSEGEAEMPALKPPDPECTFVLGAFFFNCVALTTRTMLKGSFTLMLAENDFLHHAFSKQLVRQTRNLA